jgi:CheY-like chemotaxis protein/DNA-binding XRE family transcriptional regulator
MDVKKEFGIIVKDKRTRLGLSQGALAARADLHRTYVTDIERGARNLTLENISKLAGAFGLSISQMFPSGAALSEEVSRSIQRDNSVDILMVEDNPRDVELALAAFKQARMTNRVHVVHDGEAALDFIFCQGQYRQRPVENPPGAVLLDLNLPKVHGLDVLRNIKKEKGTRDIKVVVLSISQRDAEIVEAMRLGAVGYIVKPVNFNNFSQITSQLDFSWTLLKPNGGPFLGRTNGTLNQSKQKEAQNDVHPYFDCRA